MPIKILPADVAAKIAAGEVVERPTSVVKELIENSIDAQASEIKVNIEQAGKELIEVIDSGCGITAQDLPLAVHRHATSKIEKAEDINNILTLGFRGEALASIAAVSHFSLQSRSSLDALGNQVIIAGGESESSRKISMPIGTVVRVTNLFFNTPARLKFLKKEITEHRQILSLVSRYAFMYPHIRFELIMDGRKILQTQGDLDRREILAQMYDLDTARRMLAVDFRDDFISIEGFSSPVGLNRSNRKEMTFFVNGRWIQDTALAAALLQAYHTYLMVGKYPISILMINLAPQEVDVNVHPAKAEIRLRNTDMVFSAVQRAIRKALMASSPIPAINSTAWQNATFYKKEIEPAWEIAHPHASTSSANITQEEVGLNPSIKASNLPFHGQIPLLRLVGQIGAAYLVAEGPDGLYLIDQHAAHERVLYEKFNEEVEKSRPGQMLLEPLTFQLPLNSQQYLNEKLPLLTRLGFDVEEFGESTFRIRAVPVLFSKSDPLILIKSVVENFEEDESLLKEETEKKIIARICKRAALKSGQILSSTEQSQLLADLEGCQSPRTCPHGRPTMIHLSVDLLERQFGRR